jgi:septal ring factor EnvC (AmiA/AmiB activator)
MAVREMSNIDKKTLTVIVLLLVVGCVAGYLLGGRGGNVSNNPVGADAVRSDLSNVERANSAAKDRVTAIESGLESSAAEAGSIANEIGGIADAVREIEDRIDVGQDRLGSIESSADEGQSILKRVRERGQGRTQEINIAK